LRLAAAMDLRAYAVEPLPFLQLRFRSTRRADEGSSPLPELSTSWSDDPHAEDVPAVPIPIDVLAIDACGFRSAFRPTCWAPGRQIRLEDGWASWDPPLRAFCAAIGIGLGTAFGLWAPQALREPVLLSDVNLAIALLSAFGLFALLALCGFELRRFSVDWEHRTLDVRSGIHRATIPFDDVSSVYVRLRRTRDEVRGLYGAACYQGSIVVARTGRRTGSPEEVVVLDTLTAEGDAVTPFKWASGFAVVLAGWLGVPCLYRRGEFDVVPVQLGRPVGEALEATSAAASPSIRFNDPRRDSRA